MIYSVLDFPVPDFLSIQKYMFFYTDQGLVLSSNANSISSGFLLPNIPYLVVFGFFFKLIISSPFFLSIFCPPMYCCILTMAAEERRYCFFCQLYYCLVIVFTCFVIINTIIVYIIRSLCRNSGNLRYCVVSVGAVSENKERICTEMLEYIILFQFP